MNLEQQSDISTFDPSLVNHAAHAIPEIDTSTLPHYAISMFLPIPVGMQSAQSQYGDFNPKNKKGFNKVQFNWYPAFQLMPLFGLYNRPIPPERFPTYVDEDPTPEAFDLEGFAPANQVFQTTFNRTPKECQELYYKLNKDRGAVRLESLTGIDTQDPRKDYEIASKIVSIILPMRRSSPEETMELRKHYAKFSKHGELYRLRAGFRFENPFLDQIIGHLTALQQRSPGTEISVLEVQLEKQKLQRKYFEKAMSCFAEIAAGAKKGQALAGTMLNETEKEMQNKDGVKQMYDIPDLETFDAPPPTDGAALAHTNRVEIADRQMAASANLTEQIVEPITKALGQFANQNAQTTTPKTDEMMLTQEEVDLQKAAMAAEFTEQADELKKKHAAEMAALVKKTDKKEK